jgi:hypothetical protein
MAHLELFQTEDIASETAGRPVGGRAADAPETEHDYPSAGHMSLSR